MRFRTRLLLIFALTITGAVTLVTGAVSVLTRRAFERMDQDRRQALIDQFQRRLTEQGTEVVRRMESLRASEETLRIALESGRAEPDLGPFVNDAEVLARNFSLDYLDVLRRGGAHSGSEAGTIISSAHWPAKFNYKNDWTLAIEDPLPPENAGGAFLAIVPTPDGATLALVADRIVQAGNASIELLGGKRIDAAFLASLGLAPGMRARLLEPSATDPLVASVRLSHRRESTVVGTDALSAIPLAPNGQLMGVLVLTTSLAEELSLERRIMAIGVFAALAGIALGGLMGWWATERVTRPVERLVHGVRAVAAGDWESRVGVSSPDEIGELAAAFNRMTEQLLEQRERAIQAERVAAWRELARRLAHELKNPLFPLQITVENMRRAKAQMPGEFDEVFQEGTQLLVTELSNLRAIIGRFSDFAKMPPPHPETVDVGELAGRAVKLFQAQAHAQAGDSIQTKLELHPGRLVVEADPEQLERALRNLALNAMDAMPSGGVLTVRTVPTGQGARIEVSDTGQGLTEEECSRLFTPYYTTKQHGTGLGLAIVQSVVSDHHGRIWVESAPGRGATFTIELPAKQDAPAPEPAAQERTEQEPTPK
jgi:two-component system, NtrC family, nitrogen regulation sensor histidine kinase NtrY